MIARAVEVYRKYGLAPLAKTSSSYLHRWVDKPVMALANRRFSAKYGDGESVLERDWDNLLLYDACRYDEFMEVSPFSTAAVDRRVTVGSRTPEFLPRTFDGRTCHDIVYITANPQPLKYAFERNDNPFHAMVSLLDYWDGETQTVHPEEVYKATLEVESDYPDKRLIIHFLQPHAPFIGKTANELRERTGKTIGGLNPGREYTDIEPQSIDTTSYRRIFLSDDKVSIEEIRAAYRETLAIATNYVIGLAGKLDGKTAITSDHGELLGDRLHPFGARRWEHPEGIRSSELCFVPWVECPWDERKDVKAESPTQHDEIDQERVTDRLRSLGYMN